ncbi:MAG TPA: hypothetical protein VFM14_10095 [Gemmatimonadales bacterium]|nr:hypothetical protein [Gemmatimonadales bacterium]
MPFRQPSRVCSAVLAIVAATAAPLAAQEVRNTSFRYQDSIRVRQQSVVVPASAKDVWTAITTSEGLTTWAVPAAQTDLRIGLRRRAGGLGGAEPPASGPRQVAAPRPAVSAPSPVPPVLGHGQRRRSTGTNGRSAGPV